VVSSHHALNRQTFQQHSLDPLNGFYFRREDECLLSVVHCASGYGYRYFHLLRRRHAPQSDSTSIHRVLYLTIEWNFGIWTSLAEGCF
jgi:hypothetical protein